MMIPGIGIGIPFGGHGLSPAWLAARLSAIFGVDLIGLWIGEDLVADGSNNVTSWQGRVGGTLIYAPNRAEYFKLSSMGSRRSCYGIDPIDKQRTLRVTLAAPIKSVWSVTNALGSYTHTCNLACTTAVNSGLITIGGITWYANGWSVYANGLADSAIHLGVATVYEATLASGADTGFAMGGYYNDYTPRSAWPWQMPFGMALSAIPSAGNRAAAVTALKTFYQIV